MNNKKEIHIRDDIFIYNDMPKGWLGFHPVNRSIYAKWRQMWFRTTDEFIQTRPTYKGVTVCDEWRYLSNFVAWIEGQYLFNEFKQNIKGYSIEKDLLVEGNKHYRPSTVVLSTRSANSKNAITRNGTILSEYQGDKHPSKNEDINRSRRKGAIGISSEKIVLIKFRLDAYNFGYRPTHIRRSIKEKSFYRGLRWYNLNHRHNKTYRVKEGLYYANN